jgi:hypothetical protein
MARLAGDPSIGRQLLFALGFKLPARYLDWLRHDLVDAGWRGRLVTRHFVVMLPVALVLGLALPGPIWLHVTVPLLFIVCTVGIVAMYADDIRVSRLRRHGLEPPDDPDLGRPSHLRCRRLGEAGRDRHGQFGQIRRGRLEPPVVDLYVRVGCLAVRQI